MLDEVNRDDEAYRNQIEELIIRLTKADRRSVCKTIDTMWATIDPVSIFAFRPSFEFIQSVSRRELKAAHESLRHVAHTLQAALDLGGPMDRVSRVLIRLAVMRDLLGTLFVRFLVQANREGWPLGQTILTLGTFLKGVQSTDITRESDGTSVVSERVRVEWVTTKTKLSQLWMVAREKSAKLP